MVVYVDGTIFTMQTAGGVSVYTSEILRALNESKANFKLILPRGDVKSIYNLQKKEQQVIINSLSSLSMVNILDSNVTDIFHSPYYRIPTSSFMGSVVITIHDFTHRLHIPGLRSKIFQWVQSRAIKRADKIVCVSKNTQRDLLKFYGKSAHEKSEVIYNGVGCSFYNLNLPRQQNSFVYVGSRAPYKKFEIAIKFVKKCHNGNLIIVGGGALSSNEISMLAGQRIKYTYAQPRSDEDLNKLYNKATFLIYPSEYEGFGIPILEAIRAGCIPLSFKNSSLPELFPEGYNGYLPDCISEESFMGPFDFLNTSTAFKKNLLNHSEKFSWELTGKHHLEMYRKILERRKA